MTSIRVMVAIIDPTPRHIATAKEDSWATAGRLVPEHGPPAQTATLPSGTRGEDLVAWNQERVEIPIFLTTVGQGLIF